MKYKALVSFSGLISMAEGEVREIEDPAIVNDLLKAGYIQPNAGPPGKTGHSPAAVQSELADNELPAISPSEAKKAGGAKRRSKNERNRESK